MSQWDDLLNDLVERYLDYALDANYQLAIYNDNGIRLSWKMGSNWLTPDTPPPQTVALDPMKQSTPSNSHLPRLLNLLPTLQAAGTTLAVADAPHIRLIVIYAPAHHPATSLLTTCQLAARLLADRLQYRETLNRLRQTVREQETIINHISDGLLVMDRLGILKYCNTPASHILGISVNASVGRPIKDVLDFELALNQVFDNEEGYIDRELQINSSTLNLHLIDSAIPIRDENGRMVSVVNTFRQIERVKELSYRMTMDRPNYRFADILGDADTLHTAISAARKAARSTANVVLYGESGTGKELFAQAIHTDGQKGNGPFVAINCAALPRDLVESELFGYTSGSFTGADKAGRQGKFELASGGTLFLDEIAEMPLEVQAKLLRVLQEQRVLRIGAAHSIAVNVRVIAASNQKLSVLVAQGLFREDLYYRLNVIEINIPALRDRHGDIPLLLQYFLDQYCQRLNRDSISLAPHAIQQLIQYHWPGNIRQLQNIVERLVNLSDDSRIEDISMEWLTGSRIETPPTPSVPVSAPVRSLASWEELGIRSALDATAYNISRTANALGISRPTLYAKIKRYGINLKTNTV